MKTIILGTALLLTGCAFSLGRVQPQAARTADQQQLDTLTCKDSAHLAASTAGAEATGFLLGLTIIGTPLAVGMDRQLQRDEFTKCMAIKGYTVAKDY